MEVDLNIENYDLNDLLNLFKIESNFTEVDLKQAKKLYWLLIQTNQV